MQPLLSTQPYSPQTIIHAPSVARSQPAPRSRSFATSLISVEPDEHKRHSRMELPHTFDNRAWRNAVMAGAGVAAATLLRWRQPGWAVAGAGALGLLGAAYATLFEPARPLLEHVTLRLPTLPPALDGLRIGQLADLHLGLPYAARNARWAVAQIQREQPDLLLLTGDFVGIHAAIPDLPALLRGLHAPLGMYAVTGNHDYWPDAQDVRGALALAGIPLLLNQNRCLEWNGAAFWLAGVEDVWRGQPDFGAALGGIPASAWTLLLCHAPDGADVAARYPVDLQLSGHTHGGHIRLPLLGSPRLPRHGRRYVAGCYSVGNMQLYVSRGLGGMPVRFGCRPEATILTLRRAR